MEGSVLDKQEPVEDVRPPQEEPAKSRGCFFWGCITAAVLAVLAVAGIGIGTHLLLKYARGFTADAPAEIPVYQPAEGEYEAVKARIENFKNVVEGGTSGVELVLTGDDINTLIASDENLVALKERAYVKIEDDKITVDVSIPLGEIPKFSGRYINGSATINASMESGALFVELNQVEVKGEPLPEWFMEQLRGENLAKDLYKDKEMMEVINKVQDVRVEGGKLILVSK